MAGVSGVNSSRDKARFGAFREIKSKFGYAGLWSRTNGSPLLRLG